MTFFKTFAAAAAGVGAMLGAAFAGNIVVNNDEWTWSDTGFMTAGDVSTANFAINVAEFIAGPGGTIHAYTNNFGFSQSKLATTLTDAGFTYSTGNGFAFTEANLAGYDAIFLGGYYLSATEIAVLQSFIADGGGVYLAGGTAAGGGAAGEAAAWNPFLGAYGLEFETVYNGVGGNIDTSGFAHEIFDAASPLYQNNGNSIRKNGGSAEVFGNDNDQNGHLYAVVEMEGVTVSEPALIGLFGLGLIGLGFARRRTA